MALSLSLDDLVSPTPFLDTTDLAGLLALGELELLPGEADLGFTDDHELYRRVNERKLYRQWLAEAQALAAAGVPVAPSHRVINDKLYPSYYGAFASVDEIWALRQQTTLTYPSDPLLIFAYRYDYKSDTAAVPPLPAGYPWVALTHQSAGIACHHPRFIGLILDPDPARIADLYRISHFADSPHTCLGAFAPEPLSALVAYSELLDGFSLSAEYSYPFLEEAVYPIDKSHAASLSSTPVPTDDELDYDIDASADVIAQLINLSEFPRSHWALFILADNCD